jgi:hypothetical protein
MEAGDGNVCMQPLNNGMDPLFSYPVEFGHLPVYLRTNLPRELANCTGNHRFDHGCDLVEPK